MGYTRQNFKDGMTLTADHLIKLEDGILGAEGLIITKTESTPTFINEPTTVKSGYYKWDGTTLTTSTSDKYNYRIIPINRYKITKICAITGTSANGVIPILFLSSNNMVTDSVVSCIFGSKSDYLSNSSFNVINQDITIPSGATHIAVGNYIDYTTLANTAKLEEFTELFKITYDFDSSKADDTINISTGNSGNSGNSNNSSSTQGNTYIVRKTNTQTGEFNTIQAALSKATGKDTIIIYEGIYEENHLNIPGGLTMKGIGNVIIQGHLPEDAPVKNVEGWSTLECNYGATFENITITAQNLRYPIHADFSNGKKAVWNMKKCKFIHYGNNEIYNYRGSRAGIFSACSAWGGGTYGGDTVYCEDCEFISNGRGFSTHNNTGNTYTTNGPSNVKLVNCIMTSHAIDVDGNSARFAPALFVQSLPCPVECEVVLNNCKINGSVVYQNSGSHWSNKLKLYSCNECRTIFDTYGSGTSSVSDREQNQLSAYEGQYDGFHISDDMNSFINRGNTNIQKGQPVKLSIYGGIELCDNIDDLFGIALEDINTQKSGFVQYKGYISRIYLDGIRTTTLSEGNYITIDDKKFTVTETKTKLKIVDNQNIYIS